MDGGGGTCFPLNAIHEQFCAALPDFIARLHDRSEVRPERIHERDVIESGDRQIARRLDSEIFHGSKHACRHQDVGDKKRRWPVGEGKHLFRYAVSALRTEVTLPGEGGS